MGKNLFQRRLLVSLLLLLALNCETIYYVSSNATLPQGEVDAINALIKISSRISDTEFSVSDCGTVKLQREVECDCSFNNNKTCGVTVLRFSSQEMTGKIPGEIANLTSLHGLDLSYNSLYGPIPSSLENLSSLSYIILDDNSIGGPIPTFFGRMKSLRALSLAGNSFNGAIPSELGALTSLISLYLNGNSLSKKVPPQLGNIFSLERLDLSDNRLSGRLPPELRNLTNLKYLYLYNNQLSGMVPSELGNLGNLLELDLSNNQLSGTLPKELGNLGHLEDFDVRGNNFNGSFDFIAYWKNLLFLVLLGNNFEGPSLEVFQSLTELQSLHLADITGGFQFPILNSSYLESLTLRNCSLDGQIPESIWGNRRLSYLDLSFNNLTGEIPTFASHYLLDIYLRGNELNKSSPGWFKNITKSYVDVSENSFTNLFLPPHNISKNWNLFSCCSERKTEDEPWQKENYHCDDEKTLCKSIKLERYRRHPILFERYWMWFMF